MVSNYAGDNDISLLIKDTEMHQRFSIFYAYKTAVPYVKVDQMSLDLQNVICYIRIR